MHGNSISFSLAMVISFFSMVVVDVRCSTYFRDRATMDDWNIVLNASKSDECLKSFDGTAAGTTTDYCCFNSTVKLTNQKIDGNNDILTFDAASGVGTTAGCKYLQKSLLCNPSTYKTKDPSALFLWGTNSEISQKVKLLVSTTNTTLDNGAIKYTYTFQLPANIITTTTDTKYMQQLVYEETIQSTTTTTASSIFIEAIAE